MRILVLAVVVLGGCALTPGQLSEKGERHEFTSRLTPASAASCLARNAGEFQPGPMSGGMPATVREGTARGAVEVVVQGGGDLGTTAFARVEPSPNGSQIVIWQHPDLLFGYRDLAVAMAKGC